MPQLEQRWIASLRSLHKRFAFVAGNDEKY